VHDDSSSSGRPTPGSRIAGVSFVYAYARVIILIRGLFGDVTEFLDQSPGALACGYWPPPGLRSAWWHGGLATLAAEPTAVAMAPHALGCGQRAVPGGGLCPRGSPGAGRGLASRGSKALLSAQRLERSGSALRYAAAAATIAVVDPTSAASASLLKVFFQNVAAATVQKLKAIAPARVPAHSLGETVVAAVWAAALPPAGPLPAPGAAALPGGVAADAGAGAPTAAALAAAPGADVLAASACGPWSEVLGASALAASSPPVS
jgi:hypothetical protein